MDPHQQSQFIPSLSPKQTHHPYLHRDPSPKRGKGKRCPSVTSASPPSLLNRLSDVSPVRGLKKRCLSPPSTSPALVDRIGARPGETLLDRIESSVLEDMNVAIVVDDDGEDETPETTGAGLDLSREVTKLLQEVMDDYSANNPHDDPKGMLPTNPNPPPLSAMPPSLTPPDRNECVHGWESDGPGSSPSPSPFRNACAGAAPHISYEDLPPAHSSSPLTKSRSHPDKRIREWTTNGSRPSPPPSSNDWAVRNLHSPLVYFSSPPLGSVTSSPPPTDPNERIPPVLRNPSSPVQPTSLRSVRSVLASLILKNAQLRPIPHNPEKATALVEELLTDEVCKDWTARARRVLSEVGEKSLQGASAVEGERAVEVTNADLDLSLDLESQARKRPRHASSPTDVPYVKDIRAHTPPKAPRAMLKPGHVNMLGKYIFKVTSGGAVGDRVEEPRPQPPPPLRLQVRTPPTVPAVSRETREGSQRTTPSPAKGTNPQVTPVLSSSRSKPEVHPSRVAPPISHTTINGTPRPPRNSPNHASGPRDNHYAIMSPHSAPPASPTPTNDIPTLHHNLTPTRPAPQMSLARNQEDVPSSSPPKPHRQVQISPDFEASLIPAPESTELCPVPGLWFAHVGSSHADILEVPFEVDHPSTRLLKLRVVCLPSERVQAACQSLDPAAPHGDIVEALRRIDNKWPPRGHLIIELNKTQKTAHTWMPSALNPDSPPIDATPFISSGRNVFRFIQLTNLSAHMFFLHASAKPADECAWEEFLRTQRKSGEESMVLDNPFH